MVSPAKLFGSAQRSKVLVAIALLRETYSREIARVTGVPLISVQRIVASLERDGAVSARALGSTRRLSLNRRFYGVDQLQSFLVKYAKTLPELEASVETLRRRPRRTGKDVS